MNFKTIIFIAVLQLGVSGVALAQKCSLSLDNEIASVPNYDPRQFSHSLTYSGDAPIDNVGTIHDIYGNVLCTGFIDSDYGITHSSCIRTVKENPSFYQFTVYNTRLKKSATSSFNKLSIVNSFGFFSLTNWVPYDLSTTRAGNFEQYLNDDGWLIVGNLQGNSKTAKAIDDNCTLIQSKGSGFFSYSCSEDYDFVPGAAVLGKLCNEWQFIGIKSGTGDSVITFNSQFKNYIRQAGFECNFISAEPCSSVQNTKPDIRIPSPSFLNNNENESLYYGGEKEHPNEEGFYYREGSPHEDREEFRLDLNEPNER